MEISAPCVVSLSWTLDDAQGERLDELTEPTEFFFGGSDLVPGVERALDGQAAGFAQTVNLEPEQAFGDYDSSLVCFERRSLFPDNIDVGMRFEGLPEGAATPGMPADRIYAVTEVYPEHVVLDANHPLAGIGLRLNLRVHSVRAATEDEVEAGSVSEMPLSVANMAPPAPGIH
jgi:FKBP-type peptidyl-prolyl cis-trans isomerase SlyD